MTAATKRRAHAPTDPSVLALRDMVWPHTVEMMRKAYEAEIERLADEHRDRILAGELSGYDDRNDEPRYFRLERELLDGHPWIRTVPGALAIIGISPWTRDARNTVELREDRIIRDSAAECMANDVMLLAVARGWVKRPARGERQYDVTEPYALRVA